MALKKWIQNLDSASCCKYVLIITVNKYKGKRENAMISFLNIV